MNYIILNLSHLGIILSAVNQSSYFSILGLGIFIDGILMGLLIIGMLIIMAYGVYLIIKRSKFKFHQGKDSIGNNITQVEIGKGD